MANLIVNNVEYPGYIFLVNGKEYTEVNLKSGNVVTCPHWERRPEDLVLSEEDTLLVMRTLYELISEGELWPV